jgi:hypothetical protein
LFISFFFGFKNAPGLRGARPVGLLTTPCRRRFPTVAPAAHLVPIFALAKGHIHTQVDKLFYKGKVRLECLAQLHILEIYAGVLRFKRRDFRLYGFDAALFGL